jgi:hypothetical protein
MHGLACIGIARPLGFKKIIVPDVFLEDILSMH